MFKSETASNKKISKAQHAANRFKKYENYDLLQTGKAIYSPS